ncbi:hypothetical protein OM960_23875 [Defluviimonas sp. CAU 1641]|uniref:Uncharacterized protein n=1 Tax=Defluviimonas salinarum TaxID=2992147 RepID=A0ABT3JA36_9RHOB|nr:hypothetical protein [Defluviimonas salinarum]
MIALGPCPIALAPRLISRGQRLIAFRPCLIVFGPGLFELGPYLFELGPCMVEFGPCQIELGPSLVPLGNGRRQFYFILGPKLPNDVHIGIIQLLDHGLVGRKALVTELGLSRRSVIGDGFGPRAEEAFQAFPATGNILKVIGTEERSTDFLFDPTHIVFTEPFEHQRGGQFEWCARMIFLEPA